MTRLCTGIQKLVRSGEKTKKRLLKRHSKHSGRLFQAAVPQLWYTLPPLSLRDVASVEIFKKNLKRSQIGLL